MSRFIRHSKTLVIAALPALALAGCYVIPVDSRGNAVYAVGTPVPPQHAPVVVNNPANGGPPQVVYAGASSSVLSFRLYPANDLATQTGMMMGTVTNMLTGKGRFQFDYKGELLAGEATRVNGDERRGVANAYGTRGTYVSCEYQMLSAQQGAGHCLFNNGARYEVHIGS